MDVCADAGADHSGSSQFLSAFGGGGEQRYQFFRPTAAVTMTIPATAQKVITVGAYNPLYQEYADFPAEAIR